MRCLLEIGAFLVLQGSCRWSASTFGFSCPLRQFPTRPYKTNPWSGLQVLFKFYYLLFYFYFIILSNWSYWVPSLVHLSFTCMKVNLDNCPKSLDNFVFSENRQIFHLPLITTRWLPLTVKFLKFPVFWRSLFPLSDQSVCIRHLQLHLSWSLLVNSTEHNHFPDFQWNLY